ncbi:hydrogenase maturation protease [Candidatus Latescibacterota bacterium]
MTDPSIPEMYTKRVIVLGCGNILFGDDGFGPEVIAHLERHYTIPENTYVMNAGISAREILFPILLDDQRPELIIIIDAVDAGRTQGEIFEIPVEDIPENKIDDFSMHQLPTSNLLKELQDLCKVEVVIIAVQVESIPEMVKPGLSKSLIEALPETCEMIMKNIIASNEKNKNT